MPVPLTNVNVSVLFAAAKLPICAQLYPLFVSVTASVLKISWLLPLSVFSNVIVSLAALVLILNPVPVTPSASESTLLSAIISLCPDTVIVLNA